MAQNKKSASNVLMSTTGMVTIILIVALIVGGLLTIWTMNSKNTVACTTADLQLTAGQQSGAAGTIYQHMALKNTSNRACSLQGYPTAFLYGSNGYASGMGAAPTPATPAAITLAMGETAHTVLGYPQAGNFNPGICSAKSVELKLYVPGAITALTTPLEVAWCPGFSVTAMQAGN